jgi:hypothetical protein
MCVSRMRAVCECSHSPSLATLQRSQVEEIALQESFSLEPVGALCPQHLHASPISWPARARAGKRDYVLCHKDSHVFVEKVCDAHRCLRVPRLTSSQRRPAQMQDGDGFARACTFRARTPASAGMPGESSDT